MRRTRRRAIPLASSIAVALIVAFVVSPASIAARSVAKARPVAQSWVGVDARATGAWDARGGISLARAPGMGRSLVDLAPRVGQPGLTSSARCP